MRRMEWLGRVRDWVHAPSDPGAPKGLRRRQAYLLAGAPVGLLLIFGGATGLLWPGLRGEARLVGREFREVESRLGRRLYAPTAFPAGVRAHPDTAPVPGARRVMQGYLNPANEVLCILAQEPRNPGRDKYNKRVFCSAPDRKVVIGEKQGYFITGGAGERRLYWVEKDASLILSSSVLADEDMLFIACSVR